MGISLLLIGVIVSTSLFSYLSYRVGKNSFVQGRKLKFLLVSVGFYLLLWSAFLVLLQIFATYFVPQLSTLYGVISFAFNVKYYYSLAVPFLGFVFLLLSISIFLHRSQDLVIDNQNIDTKWYNSPFKFFLFLVILSILNFDLPYYLLKNTTSNPCVLSISLHCKNLKYIDTFQNKRNNEIVKNPESILILNLPSMNNQVVDTVAQLESPQVTTVNLTIKDGKYEIPESLFSIKSIKEFNISFQTDGLKDVNGQINLVIPSGVTNLSELENIAISVISGRDFDSDHKKTIKLIFPDKISDNSKLKVLFFTGNYSTRGIDVIEGLSFKTLSNLEMLYVSYMNNFDTNIFSTLPGSTLKEIKITHSTAFRSLSPNSLSNLPYLEKLEISDSAFRVLPENIGDITNLKSLDVSGDYIKAIPKSLLNLKKLESFQAEDVCISDLEGKSFSSVNELPEQYKRIFPETIKKFYLNSIDCSYVHPSRL